jgi:hypothetical protein
LWEDRVLFHGTVENHGICFVHSGYDIETVSRGLKHLIEQRIAYFSWRKTFRSNVEHLEM